VNQSRSKFSPRQPRYLADRAVNRIAGRNRAVRAGIVLCMSPATYGFETSRSGPRSLAVAASTRQEAEAAVSILLL